MGWSVLTSGTFLPSVANNLSPQDLGLAGLSLAVFLDVHLIFHRHFRHFLRQVAIHVHDRLEPVGIVRHSNIQTVKPIETIHLRKIYNFLARFGIYIALKRSIGAFL